MGQTSLGQTTAAGTTAAGNIGANIANAGAAQAGGIVGSANAISGGLQSFGNQQYLSNLLASKNPAVTVPIADQAILRNQTNTYGQGNAGFRGE